MEFIKDIIQYEFLRVSLVSTILTSVITSFISPIIVYKKMEFIGDGLAHAIFAGVAFAVIFQFNIFFGAILATIVFAFLTYKISQSYKLSESTIIGILLPVFMSIGTILFSKANKYTSDLLSYLFGNLLMISVNDLYFLIAITAFTIIFITSKTCEISYWISDESMAEFYGINTKKIKLLTLINISFAVVAALKIAGVVVMGAFLVLPGVFAKKNAKSLIHAVYKGLLFNMTCSIVGFIVSYYLNIPPGPSIVLISFAILVFTFLHFGEVIKTS
ncbi:MAG: metal ABC transporter permease [Fervidobacterium sp.]